MGIMTMLDLSPEYILDSGGKPKAVILTLECVTALLERINQHAQAEYVCEYGYSHTPNQETIDAINDDDTETVTLEELMAMSQ